MQNIKGKFRDRNHNHTVGKDLDTKVSQALWPARNLIPDFIDKYVLSRPQDNQVRIAVAEIHVCGKAHETQKERNHNKLTRVENLDKDTDILDNISLFLCSQVSITG